MNEFEEAFENLLSATKSDDDTRPLDLTGFRFPNGFLASRIDFDRPVIMTRATFAGPVDLRKTRFERRVDFSHVVFERAADFSESKFEEEAVFYKVKFEGPATFYQTKFLSDSMFYGSSFAASAVFLQASWKSRESRVYFEDVSFEENASFGGAIFEGSVSFSDAVFTNAHQISAFNSVIFRSGVMFLRTRFRGPVVFNFSEFHELADFRQVVFDALATFKKCEFRGQAIFEDIACADTTMQDRVMIDFRHVFVHNVDGVRFAGVNEALDLSRARFAFADVHLMRFTNVGWRMRGDDSYTLWDWVAGKNVEPGIFLCDEKYLKPQSVVDNSEARTHTHTAAGVVSIGSKEWEKAQEEQRKRSEQSVSYAQLSTTYKGLRESYERALRYDEAGLFYVRELEMRRLSGETRSSWKRIVRRNFSFINVYRIVSKYGESHQRSLSWLFLVYSAFFLSRVVGGESLEGAAWKTFVAFGGLNTGDAMDFLQGVVGIPLIAFFGLALRRSFAR